MKQKLLLAFAIAPLLNNANAAVYAITNNVGNETIGITEQDGKPGAIAKASSSFCFILVDSFILVDMWCN